MKVFNLIIILFKFFMNVSKFMMKMIVVFTVLALIFGIQASMTMTLILIVVMSLMFVNKLLSVTGESHSVPETYEEIEPYYFFKDDHWTPGQPAITQKAFIYGFFDV